MNNKQQSKQQFDDEQPDESMNCGTTNSPTISNSRKRSSLMTSNSQTEIKKLERNKAERTRYDGIFKKGKAIVAQGKSIYSLNGIELDALLTGIPSSEEGPK